MRSQASRSSTSSTEPRTSTFDGPGEVPPLDRAASDLVGLDPNQVREVRDLVKALAEKRTVLFSTHVIPWVEAVCERVIVIAGGRIVADGPDADQAVSALSDLIQAGFGEDP